MLRISFILLLFPGNRKPSNVFSKYMLNIPINASYC